MREKDEEMVVHMERSVAIPNGLSAANSLINLASTPLPTRHCRSRSGLRNMRIENVRNAPVSYIIFAKCFFVSNIAGVRRDDKVLIVINQLQRLHRSIDTIIVTTVDPFPCVFSSGNAFRRCTS